MEKVKLKITTLTPVTIGSGVELSPYADYVIDNGHMHDIFATSMSRPSVQDNRRNHIDGNREHERNPKHGLFQPVGIERADG